MFEKDAEEKGVEYANKQKKTISINEDTGYSWGQIEEGYENGFKDGAEFGYNKANEWHYVKDGDLPEKSDSTLRQLLPVTVAVKIAGVSSAITTYGTWWDIRRGKFECLDEVYAWCYTPEPPELPKESE